MMNRIVRDFFGAMLIFSMILMIGIIALSLATILTGCSTYTPLEKIERVQLMETKEEPKMEVPVDELKNALIVEEAYDNLLKYVNEDLFPVFDRVLADCKKSEEGLVITVTAVGVASALFGFFIGTFF